MCYILDGSDNMAKVGKKPVIKYEQPACPYEITSEGTLVKMHVRCKECPINVSNLEYELCYQGILKAMQEEYNIDLLTLSHYVERQYAGEAIEILRKITQFTQELDQLAMRLPPPLEAERDQRLARAKTVRTKESFPGTPPSSADSEKQLEEATEAPMYSKASKRLNCPKCAFNPQNLFSRLKNAIIKDFGSFYTELSSKVNVLGGANPPDLCYPCLAITVEDLGYMYNQIEAIRTQIVFSAFKIVS